MISGNLFTRDYLLEGIAQTEQWGSLSEDDFASIKKKLLNHARKLLAGSKPNEAQAQQHRRQKAEARGLHRPVECHYR